MPRDSACSIASVVCKSRQLTARVSDTWLAYKAVYVWLWDSLSATKVVVVVVHSCIVYGVALVLGCDATSTPAEHQAI